MHAPQFWGFSNIRTQSPLQNRVPYGQGILVHTPSEHHSPAAHACPQLPQWSGLLSTLVTAPLQCVRQSPSMHPCPAPQRLPHSPQFWVSLPVRIHVPLQNFMPVSKGHVQILLEQIWFDGQRILQPPQFTVSLCVGMHRPLQSEVSRPHVHRPFTHC